MVFDSWAACFPKPRTAILAALPRTPWSRLTRERDGQGCRTRVHEGRRPVAGRASRRRVATRSGSTGRWTSDRARALVGDKVALQGNLDPSVLFAPGDAIATEAKRISTRSGRIRVTCSTSATGSRNSRRPRPCRCLSTRCTSTAASCAAAAEPGGAGRGALSIRALPAAIRHTGRRDALPRCHARPSRPHIARHAGAGVSAGA